MKPNATVVIESRWGAVCQGSRTGGEWTASKTELHINVLELKAALLAMQSFLKNKTNVSVLIRGWNRSHKQDERADFICIGPDITRTLGLVFGAQSVFPCRALSRQGEYPSRLGVSPFSQQQRLAAPTVPSVFKSFQESLGAFSVDLLVSQTNHQLLDYCSWKLDPAGKRVDAFSIPWSFKQPYFFPPFSLIGRALAKIQAEAITSACLIAPAWPAQSWYPKLLSMLVKSPVMLPSKAESGVIATPSDSRGLAAWLSEQHASTSCLSRGKVTHIQHINQPGLSGIAGIVEGKSIPFLQLWEI